MLEHMWRTVSIGLGLVLVVGDAYAQPFECFNACTPTVLTSTVPPCALRPGNLGCSGAGLGGFCIPCVSAVDCLPLGTCNSGSCVNTLCQQNAPDSGVVDSGVLPDSSLLADSGSPDIHGAFPDATVDSGPGSGPGGGGGGTIVRDASVAAPPGPSLPGGFPGPESPPPEDGGCACVLLDPAAGLAPRPSGLMGLIVVGAGFLAIRLRRRVRPSKAR
jgi:hypothetical protein